MFDNLTERLSQTVQQLRGKGRLTEDGIRETLREVRIALLEADVALPVVQAFLFSKNSISSSVRASRSALRGSHRRIRPLAFLIPPFWQLA